MTEQQWLTSTDPKAMLTFAVGTGGGSLSDRKLRLFACACARLLENSPPRPERTAVIEACELVADGRPTQWGAGIEALTTARKSIDLAWGWTWSATWDNVTEGLAGSFYRQEEEIAALLRDVAGNPWRPAPVIRYDGQPYYNLRSEGPGDLYTAHDGLMWDKCLWVTPQVHALAQAAYEVRPGRECEVCPKWQGVRTDRHGYYETDAVQAVINWGKARKACVCGGSGRTQDGSLDPEALLVLADALEEAGCADEYILRHLRSEERCGKCRGTGDGGDNYMCPVNGRVTCTPCKSRGWVSTRSSHVRGCHVVDAILGKE